VSEDPLEPTRSEDGPAGPPRRRRTRRAGDPGEVEVGCFDEQGDVAVDTDRYRRFVSAVLADEGVRGDVEMNLLFVDEATIASLNATHMGHDGPTDVLAFPIDDDVRLHARAPADQSRAPATRDELTDRGPLMLGDVVVCPAVAARQAPDHRGSYQGHEGATVDELDLLVVHGVLHLLGHDHAEADEATAMRAAEHHHLQTFRPR
jgi:probable rRNA maturation factor